MVDGCFTQSHDEIRERSVALRFEGHFSSHIVTFMTSSWSSGIPLSLPQVSKTDTSVSWDIILHISSRL